MVWCYFSNNLGATLVTLLIPFYGMSNGATQNRTGSSGVRILHRNHVDHSTFNSLKGVKGVIILILD